MNPHLNPYRVRIYYEDTDCGGIIYHTNYLKYCERARSEMFFSKNAKPHTDSIGLVVRTIEANFLGTAALGDELEVRAKICEIKKASLVMEQEIFLGDKMIFQARIKLASIDISRKKATPIPSEILKTLEQL